MTLKDARKIIKKKIACSRIPELSVGITAEVSS